jgi:RNA polymerase sigma-70 factor (ECF subfamily)
MLADERTLIQQVAHGEAAALQTLYTLYRPRLFRYFGLHFRDDLDAVDDLLQETFLAIWRAAASFRGQAQVSTWIFQIAHNQLAHALHKRHGRTTWLSDLEEHTLPVGATLEESVMAQLTVTDALERLSPKQREMLSLLYHHGFSIEETAQILEIPVGTVKSRLHSARNAFIRALRSEEEAHS